MPWVIVTKDNPIGVRVVLHGSPLRALIRALFCEKRQKKEKIDKKISEFC
jgi:hypothetical protein